MKLETSLSQQRAIEFEAFGLLSYLDILLFFESAQNKTYQHRK